MSFFVLKNDGWKVLLLVKMQELSKKFRKFPVKFPLKLMISVRVCLTIEDSDVKVWHYT